MSSPLARQALEGARQVLTGAHWSVEGVETALRGMLNEHDLSARKGLQPIRVSLTGSSVSPPLFESIVALGREATLARIDRALEAI